MGFNSGFKGLSSNFILQILPGLQSGRFPSVPPYHNWWLLRSTRLPISRDLYKLQCSFVRKHLTSFSFSSPNSFCWQFWFHQYYWFIFFS